MSKLQKAMNRTNFFPIVMVVLAPFFIWACSSSQSIAKQGPQRILIETSRGELIVELSDSTPGHRDNFVKLVDEGFYDGLLFHRVIQGFMYP